MSWSASTPEPCAKSAVLDSLQVSPQSGDDDVVAAFEEQLAAAKAALPSILDVVGPADALVGVSISGHAQPGRGTADGNELLTVGVYVIRPRT